MNSLNEVLSQYLSHYELKLKAIIEQTEIPALRIKDAMNYCLFPGGKRLRPLLIYLCGELLEVKKEVLDPMAIAIELIHSYSLIHDDLPAMDNDDIRRGKASCHRAFDEATAILVGDGMQALAIEVLLTQLSPLLSPEKTLAVTQELLKACGFRGMVSGQSLDLWELAAPGVSESQLCIIHQLKTGKMLSACVEMTIAACHPTQETAERLRDFVNYLGLLFQLEDDYLDRYDPRKVGKNRASDTANQKTTFATLYEQEELLNYIAELHQQTIQPLETFGEKADLLRIFMELLLVRITG